MIQAIAGTSDRRHKGLLVPLSQDDDASCPPHFSRVISLYQAARAGELGLDSGKLVRLVAELNDNYSRGNAYAAHALLRG